nr:UDP-glycosyltransferase [Paris polyphylla]
MLKSQILNPKFVVGMEGMMRQLKETVEQSYGVLVNSFYELEPEYVRHCREVVGWRAWHVGPVSLCNVEEADKVGRGGDKNKISSESCLEWLDGKEPGSVLYVCFGSEGEFTAAQLDELAVGLEASGCPFMWVVRSEVLPAGFEEKVEGRGMVARGWAPQISILSHRATGGFLTHCGWNSSMEGLVAGLPMATVAVGSGAVLQRAAAGGRAGGRRGGGGREDLVHGMRTGCWWGRPQWRGRWGG